VKGFVSFISSNVEVHQEPVARDPF
jgi:hypothetical protein